MARVAKKTATRRTKTTTARRRTAAPAARPSARPAAASSAASSAASAAGPSDLAGGLKSLLGAIETEVREVGALSERIDKLVADLNARREDQTRRLLALDALRASVDDAGLGSFLDKAIRPRKPRVQEVIPKRLTQFL